MKQISDPTSHHPLTSHLQYFTVVLPKTRGRRGSVRWLQSYIVTLGLMALVAALSPATVLARAAKQNGAYDITISGYYRGAGTAAASGNSVSINAVVKDEAGKSHRLTATAQRDPDRYYLFSGRGSLDGMDVLIDGRVDAPDLKKNDVLKKGRIVFTFKVLPNGRHGRGSGEKHGGGNGNNGNNGNGNNGNGNNGNGNNQNGDNGIGNDGTPGNGGAGPGNGGGSAGNGNGNPGNGNPGNGNRGGNPGSNRNHGRN
jgi:hypothetical protein